MPINRIYFVLVLILMIVLLLNLVYPLFVEKYKLFWMFRRDPYTEAFKKRNSMPK